MNNQPIKFLLIGCGGISSAHLDAFEQHPDKLLLVAACDPSEAAVSKVAERMAQFGEVSCFTKHEDAISKVADNVDAALITTPHFLHYPQTLACIEAGLPVLVEKPVTNTLDEVRILRDRSGELGIPVMVGQTRRFSPDANQMKQWIHADPKNFGELRSFDLTGWQSIEAWIADKPDPGADFWILDKERAGGGVVISLLIHYIDLVRFLFDLDYAQVSARGRHDPPFKNGAESSATALLTMENGTSGTMHANYLARKTIFCETYHFLGEYGFVGNHPMEYGQYEGPVAYATSGGNEPTGWNYAFEDFEVIDKKSLNDVPNGFVAQLLSFAESISSNQKPLNTIEDNFNTMAVVDAIYQSIAMQGKPVEVVKS